MKTVILASVLLAAATVNAEVKPVGTFVPSLCSSGKSSGPTISIVAVKSVCYGKLEGLNQKAVKLYLNDNSDRTYAVNLTGKLGGMGASKAQFSGQAVNVQFQDQIQGVLSMTRGITTTYGISLKTSSNLKFQGPLRVVAVTQ